MISGRKKHIKKSLKYLTPLSKLPTHKSTSITHLLSDQAIHAICESCHNIITNTFGLSGRKLMRIKSKFNKSKKNMRLLANPSTSLLRKRRILSSEQTGKGVFSLIASVVIPALIAALSK